MKIEIPLQFFLVCILILGVSVFIGVYYLQKRETFVDVKAAPIDTDIQLQACPSGTTSFNKKGSILCCDGTIVNEMCNGRTVCSVSDETSTTPSCVNLLRKELSTKSLSMCPPSLPNYFQDKEKRIFGCTDGNRTPDGKAPFSSTQNTCKIYMSQEENLNKLDSCDNIKQKELFNCPQGKTPTLVSPRSDKPALVQCSFMTNTDPQPLVCYSDKSLMDHMLALLGPDWKKGLTREAKLSFCSTAQKYYIDRGISEEELELLEGPYTGTIKKQQNCVFNARMYANRYPALRKQFGYNQAKLRQHYINVGLKEGRTYKPGCVFDPLKYAEYNPDLKRIFKNNRTSLTNHYKLSGIKENRVFNKV